MLSTGGFIFNREMVARYAPKYLRNFRLGTSGCDGSGIRLGESAGGEAARLERVSAWRFINPPLAWARGMIVDSTRRALLQRGSLWREARLRDVRASRRQSVPCNRFDDPARRVKEALSGKLWGFQSVPALVLTLRERSGQARWKISRDGSALMRR